MGWKGGWVEGEGADEKIVVRNFRGKKIGQRVLQACVLPRATRSTAIGSWIDRVGDLMTHDLLRQTSKPRIPPSIPVRVESRIRRSSTLLSLFLHWFPFFPLDQDSSLPPASNDNVSFVWIRFDSCEYRVINLELAIHSLLEMFLGY